MLIKEEYQINEVSQYTKGLLLSFEEKVCVTLGKNLGISHDKVNRILNNAANNSEETIKSLQSLAKRALIDKQKYLLIDDTLIPKEYSKKIEGVEDGFDVCLNRSSRGIRVITQSLTDGAINIPINAVPFTSKALARDNYVSKSIIACELAKETIKTLDFDILLADSHFATKASLPIFAQLKISILMKIARNRIVSIGDKKGQLQNMLRLKRNCRMSYCKAFFDEHEYFFYVARTLQGNTIYFVSNIFIERNKLLALYRIRWNIELFHRTAKQYLGIKDCQMTSINKQRQHILFCMHAYALASVYQNLMGLHSVEDFINHLRKAKSKMIDYLFGPLERNFRHVA